MKALPKYASDGYFVVEVQFLNPSSAILPRCSMKRPKSVWIRYCGRAGRPSRIILMPPGS